MAMNSIMQDLRYAMRQLRRAPGFAATAILTIALGIGAATAVFSVIDATLLRPLPYVNRDRIVSPDTRSIVGWHQPWSLPSYRDARPQLSTFEALAGYNPYGRINLEAPSGPVSLKAVKGTDNFFQVFGVKPLLGRTYLPGEDQPGKDDVAVLSYEVWQRDFGGQRDVVGKVIRLDGAPYTVIGVMPAGFRFPLSAVNAIYTPLHPDPQYLQCRGCHWMESVGLLRPGVTREQGQANFSSVFANLARAFPDTDSGRTVQVKMLKSVASGKADGPLYTLGAAVLALLAIACVNVAGLLLARGVQREREMALRAAVGAARGRIVRQMLTESLVLSSSGLLVGIGMAYLLLAGMRTFLVSALARGVDVQLNLPVLGLAVLLSGATSVLAAVVPALRLSGTDPNRALRAGGSAGTSRGQARLRSAFVVTQVALSLVLLVVSGILLRNLSGLLGTRLGFAPERILAVPIALAPANYANRDPLATLYLPLMERVRHLPGVEAAGIINITPIETWGFNRDVHVSGQPPYPQKMDATAEIRYVSPGYFEAMGIQLRGGRMLSPALDPWQNPAGTVVVNEAFRRKFLAQGGDPVGAHLDDNEKAELKTGIVGMTTDIRQDLREEPLAEMDFLVDELPPNDRLSVLSNMTLMVRTTGEPQQVAAPIRVALHDLDASIPFQTPLTMAQVVSESLVFERMENWLFGIFAGLALLLALVGLYGLTAHEVELRTRDIGIRMALGSTRAQVVRQILTRVAALMLTGVAAGWLITLAAQKVLASVIEIHPAKDATLLAALTFTLVLIGIASALWPSRRAASINPIEALRTE
jgi:predicted permease